MAKTMDGRYEDGSDHLVCQHCGCCIACGDCVDIGCGEEVQSEEENAL